MNLGDGLRLYISGLGIIFYSPSSATHIARGEDYLSAHYWAPEDVHRHIQAGTLVGFATGSPGTYELKFADGYPSPDRLGAAGHKLRLGVHVTGGCLLFRDLYDLMAWKPECPEEQRLSLEDGYYDVTLCSDTPPSGVLGDEQQIEVYFAKLSAMPPLATEGVPTLVIE